MAEFSGVNIHVRSISLPSRLNHNSLKVETELNKLKIWKSPSGITSSETINMGLDGLSELFNNVDDLIQTLHQQKHKNLTEQALDESLKLLDTCAMIRDLFAVMKEQVQNLQSALRRKSGVSIIESDIHAFICCRKKVKKDIAKCLKTLKPSSSTLFDVDENVVVVTNVISDVSEISLSVFRTVLLYLSEPEMKTKGYGWSMISKMMITGSSTCSDTKKRNVNEMGSVDSSIYALHQLVKRIDSKVSVDMEQMGLRKLDISINGIEQRLHGVFRQLIRYRVSLLNILTS